MVTKKGTFIITQKSTYSTAKYKVEIAVLYLNDKVIII
jgi:hypothetical protein